LIEPAAAVTDYLLALIAACMAVSLLRSPSVDRYWAFASFSIALGALVGGIYHGHIVEGDRADETWTLITIIVAVTVSFLLAATVNSVLGSEKNRLWMTLRLVSLGGFVLLALAGHGGLQTFFYLESVSMLAVLGIWVYAWQRGQEGASLILAAIFVSGVASVFRFLPVGFEAGWHWDNDAIYHIAQIPGLLILYCGLQRLGPPVAQAESLQPRHVTQG
jgi:hypothetical protein